MRRPAPGKLLMGRLRWADDAATRSAASTVVIHAIPSDACDSCVDDWNLWLGRPPDGSLWRPVFIHHRPDGALPRPKPSPRPRPPPGSVRKPPKNLSVPCHPDSPHRSSFVTTAVSSKTVHVWLLTPPPPLTHPVGHGPTGRDRSSFNRTGRFSTPSSRLPVARRSAAGITSACRNQAKTLAIDWQRPSPQLMAPINNTQ